MVGLGGYEATGFTRQSYCPTLRCTFHRAVCVCAKIRLARRRQTNAAYLSGMAACWAISPCNWFCDRFASSWTKMASMILAVRRISR
jgi:hypothetical protein